MRELEFQSIVKFIVAVVGAGLIALQSALTDGITNSEWVGIGIAVVTALGVYALPNKSDVRNPDLSVQDPD